MNPIRILKYRMAAASVDALNMGHLVGNFHLIKPGVWVAQCQRKGCGKMVVVEASIESKFEYYGEAIDYACRPVRWDTIKPITGYFGIGINPLRVGNH